MRSFCAGQKSSSAKSWDVLKKMPPSSFQRADGDVKIAVLLGLGWEQTEAVEALLKHEGNLRSVINEFTHDRK